MKRSQRSAAGAVLAACSLLIGCTSFPGARPLTYATQGEARLYVSGDSCVHYRGVEELGTLVTGLLTGVASQLLSNFGNALQEGAKGGALPSSIATRNLLLEPQAVPKCVVVVRGSFAGDGDNAQPLDLAKKLGLQDHEADRRGRLASLKVPPLYRLDHWIELQLFSSPNSKALSFAPMYVLIDHSIDGGKKGSRDVSVALQFQAVGADPTGSTLLLSDRRIGKSSADQAPDDKDRFVWEAPWFTAFHEAASAKKAAEQAPTLKSPAPNQPVAAKPANASSGPVGGVINLTNPSHNQVVPNAGGPQGQTVDPYALTATAVPIVVTATVVETRPTNEGMAFIAAAFGAAKPSIDEALKPLIDSKAKATAAEKAETDQIEALGDLESAVGIALAAKINYCESASSDNTTAGKLDRLEKSTAALSAQLKLNSAAIKAKQTDRRQTSLFTISDKLPAQVNATACTS